MTYHFLSFQSIDFLKTMAASSASPAKSLGYEPIDIKMLLSPQDLCADPASVETVQYRGIYRKDLSKDIEVIKALNLEYPLFFDHFRIFFDDDDPCPLFISGCTLMKSLDLALVRGNLRGTGTKFPRWKALAEKANKALDHIDAQGFLLDNYLLCMDPRLEQRKGPVLRDLWAELIQDFRDQLRQPMHPGKGSSFWAPDDMLGVLPYSQTYFGFGVE